jgi:hypothetical protein
LSRSTLVTPYYLQNADQGLSQSSRHLPLSPPSFPTWVSHSAILQKHVCSQLCATVHTVPSTWRAFLLLPGLCLQLYSWFRFQCKYCCCQAFCPSLEPRIPTLYLRLTSLLALHVVLGLPVYRDICETVALSYPCPFFGTVVFGMW